MRDDVMPTLTGIDGCIGMSCLVERESGRCITTTAWDSSAAMQASRDQVAPVRKRVLDAFGAKDPLIEEWEIPVMHRAHPAPSGACARLSWFKVDPARMDNLIESFKMVMPELDDLTGFCSGSLLINRDTGQCVSTVVYEDSEALAHTRDIGNTLRRRVAQQNNAEVLEVAEFELALAHLRVPELV